MPSIQLDSLSAFGRQAVTLDGDLTELVRLSGQIQRLDIESDSGLDRAFKLLDQFAQHGKGLSDSMQEFSRLLHDLREQSEVAAKRVAERAQTIVQRRQQQNQIREKLNQVEEKVQAANVELTGFRKEGKEFSVGERARIGEQLENLNIDLKKFLLEAQGIKEEAARTKFKGVERDAQTLLEVLRTSTRRVDKAVNP